MEGFQNRLYNGQPNAVSAILPCIRQYGLEEVIHQVVKDGTPFLGICLGLQLLFERSDESPGVEGLGKTA